MGLWLSLCSSRRFGQFAIIILFFSALSGGKLIRVLCWGSMDANQLIAYLQDLSSEDRTKEVSIEDPLEGLMPIVEIKQEDGKIVLTFWEE